ncbi:MAG: lamin tail domain-containing protein [Pirellulales bacterium]
MRSTNFAPLLFSRVALAALALVAAAAPASATILITEVNSNGTGGDFFELYNYGESTVDLAGYLWTDASTPAYNGEKTYSLNSFSLSPGRAAVFVSDGGQNGPGNAAFVTNWGSPLTLAAMGSFTGPSPPESNTGRGLGKNDGVLLWDPSGNFVSGVNYGTLDITVTSVGPATSTLAPFNRVGGGTSAGDHAGFAGGGNAAESLIWDPTSSPNAPLYTAASSVGLYGSFASVASATTIGSPSIVPEPSTVGLGVAAGLGLAGVAARRRLRKS